MSKQKPSPKQPKPQKPPKKTEGKKPPQKKLAKEYGGFESKKLPEPTRYGDWEVGGRCSDF
ncbi:MAG: hypothetical protein DHS20C02_12710 [Micavibrio sp.]|nr:MAG: hypothetical protein DHS20C02_12710 [Micavibrio sp.]